MKNSSYGTCGGTSCSGLEPSNEMGSRICKVGRLLIIPPSVHILRFGEELESVKQEVTPRRLVPYIAPQAPLRKYMVPISLWEQEHVHFSVPLTFGQMTVTGSLISVISEIRDCRNRELKNWGIYFNTT